jgi:MFS family permease
LTPINTPLPKKTSLPSNTALSVLVLCAINLLNFYDRQAPGALVEPMRREFGLSDTQIGLLGSMFIWVYAVAGVPLGRVADVWSRKKLLTIGVTVWSALTAAAGLAASFSFLVFTRLGVGVGEAVCAPVGTSWIGDLFPAKRRARVLSVFMLGVPIGGALSFLLCGPIAQAWGWRTALVSAAAPAIILVPLLLLVREPARGASEDASASAIKVKGELQGEAKGSIYDLLRIRTLWWIILSGALLNFNMYALATFLPAFMTRVHGYSVARAGVTCGIVYLIGGVCGGLLGGHVGDLVASNARNARLWMAAIIALLGAPIMFYGITRRAGFAPAALVAIAIGYGAFNTYYGPVYSSIQDIVPPNQRGFTMSVYFMAMYLCGASFGPLLTGRLSDYMARRAMNEAGAVSLAGFRAIGLQKAMVIMPMLSVALAIVLYLGSRTMSQDVERRDARIQG